MKVSFISTAAISHVTRQSVSEIQLELTKAQQELASGHHADTGLELGFKTGRTVAMRQEFDRLTTIGETNGVLKERMTASQDALDRLVQGAQSMMATLLGARNSASGPEVAAQAAKSELQAVTETLNVTFGDVSLFGGINTDIAPMADYFSNPASQAKQAVDADFITAFGFNQDSASVETISAASLQNFLNGAFAGQFDSGPWATNWSSASDQVVESRISVSMTVQSSVTANDEAFRQLTKALTMIADLGAENLNQSAFQALSDTSIDILGGAISGLTSLQSTIGVAQEDVQLADERMELQKQLLTASVQDLEGVDPFEVSTRVTTLLTQLETSYAVTARIQQLSFTNYI